MMNTYTNSFHGTTAKSRLDREELFELEVIEATSMDRDEVRAAKRTLNRVWKKLCGIESCTCGNRIGER